MFPCQINSYTAYYAPCFLWGSGIFGLWNSSRRLLTVYALFCTWYLENDIFEEGDLDPSAPKMSQPKKKARCEALFQLPWEQYGNHMVPESHFQWNAQKNSNREVSEKLHITAAASPTAKRLGNSSVYLNKVWGIVTLNALWHSKGGKFWHMLTMCMSLHDSITELNKSIQQILYDWPGEMAQLLRAYSALA